MDDRATTGVELLLAAFAALSEVERDEAERRITQLQDERHGADASVGGSTLAALRRVAEATDGPLTPEVYRAARKEWRGTDREVPPFNRLVEHYGSWARAREALALSESAPGSGRGGNQVTARRIDARFRSRRVGKVWRYTDEKLRETLLRCAAELGRAPLVAEFEHWRHRECELAQARGEVDWHLPSATPYRKRWGGWDGALRHFEVPGIQERLDPTGRRPAP